MTADQNANRSTAPNPRPVRGTQLTVEFMGWVFVRPSLTSIEVLWRWLVGAPFLSVCLHQAHKLLIAWPLQDSGFNSIDFGNPWLAAIQLGGVYDYYAPHAIVVLRWLIPIAGAAWIVASGLGRNALMVQMEPGMPWRPISMIALQGAWALLLALTLYGWFCLMHWTAAAHLAVAGEPDLVGLSIWSIWITLGCFVFFAMTSWVMSVSPVLMLCEGRRRSPLWAVGQACVLGKAFSAKLVEVNMVMGIVKMALIVLAMVFSAAPLPFSDELGPAALQIITGASVVFYLVASDYFQVVRLKALIEFWKVFRANAATQS